MPELGHAGLYRRRQLGTFTYVGHPADDPPVKRLDQPHGLGQVGLGRHRVAGALELPCGFQPF
jgi:hypothetical protein